MNTVLLTGAPRTSRLRDFLRARTHRLVEQAAPPDPETALELKPDLLVIHGGEHPGGEPVAQPGRAISLCASYLPWGRGPLGDLWSIFEDTPTGVSLHCLGKEPGEGPGMGGVIARRLALPGPDDTLQTFRDALLDEAEGLFMERWEDIAAGRAHATPLTALDELGTAHNREAGERLLALCPQGWRTPVARLAELGREFRADAQAFARRHGAAPYGEHAPPLAAAISPAGARLEGEVAVRRAEAGDCLINWLWVNDPVTREMFKNNDYVGFSGHQRWYARLLERGDMTLYIGHVDGQRIGNVRFDLRAPQTFEISINLDPRHRGRGLGPRMLAGAIAAFCAQTPVAKLYAMAKKRNPSSFKTFAKAGLPVVAQASPQAWERGFDPETEVYMERTFG